MYTFMNQNTRWRWCTASNDVLVVIVNIFGVVVFVVVVLFSIWRSKMNRIFFMIFSKWLISSLFVSFRLKFIFITNLLIFFYFLSFFLTSFLSLSLAFFLSVLLWIFLTFSFDMIPFYRFCVFFALHCLHLLCCCFVRTFILCDLISLSILVLPLHLISFARWYSRRKYVYTHREKEREMDANTLAHKVSSPL